MLDMLLSFNDDGRQCFFFPLSLVLVALHAPGFEACFTMVTLLPNRLA